MGVRTTSPDIAWERIDKKRFFVVGTGVFSGITTCLFPLSVIKTRMMTLDTPQGQKGGNVGLQATVRAVRSVVSQEGIRGLYRGFGASVTGFLPARLVYLSTLESVKSKVKKVLNSNTQFDQTRVVAISSFLSGACASLASQTIFVPVDVISQQQMISVKRISVVDKVKTILRTEGVRGFYRGYWMSVSLFVPGSAIWWGSYSVYKEKYWSLLMSSPDKAAEQAAIKRPQHLEEGDGEERKGISRGKLSQVQTSPVNVAPASTSAESGSWRLIGIQAISAVSAGCTTSFVTTPLDVIKTRFQTADRQLQSQAAATATPAGSSSASPSIGGSSGAMSNVPQRLTASGVISTLFKKEGFWGFYRGLFPRMTASSLWGTSMILAYEFLKRNCVAQDE